MRRGGIVARRSALLGLVALGLLSGPASAVCTDVPAVRTRPMVKAFLIRPVSLLERFPLAGPDLSDRLLVVLTGDPTATLPAVLRTIRSANYEQREAIGTAMAAAYASCVRFGDARAAEQLQFAASGLGDDMVRSTFYAAMAATESEEPSASVPAPLGGNGLSLPTGRLPSPFDPLRPADPNQLPGTIR